MDRTAILVLECSHSLSGLAHARTRTKLLGPLHLQIIAKNHTKGTTMKALRALIALLPAVVFAISGAHANAADLIANGDFSTGDLTGWTVVTTSNGTNGTGFPTVTTFNFGSGSVNAADFEVGEVNFTGLYEGGGLTQTVDASGVGSYTYAVDYAAYAPFAGNASGGEFSLIIDGVTVASNDIANINQGQTLTGAFSGTVSLNPGDNTVEVEITRPYISVQNLTPLEYIGDISLDGAAGTAPVPEPGTILLAGSGLAALAARLRRRRASNDV
jgi:hypothetical protein